jgi:phage protein D
VTFLDIDQSKQSKIKSELLSLEVLRDPKTGDTLEVDRGHKGKLVEKIVYERQKHIFPYKNWKIVSESLMIRLLVRSDPGLREEPDPGQLRHP